MDQDTLIPFIKPEAVISVSMGTLIISDLQKALTYLLRDHSEEELSEIRDRLSSGGEVPEWASHASTLTRFITEILELAKSQDMVEYKSIGSIVQ
jgi:hypothetical protein